MRSLMTPRITTELTQGYLRFSRGVAGGSRCCGETGSRCGHGDGRWHRCCQGLLTKESGLVKLYSFVIHGVERQDTDLRCDGGSDVRILGRVDGGGLGCGSVDFCC